MLSKIVGTILKKNTKSKDWWAKLSLAIILSNIFFFYLFGGDNSSSAHTPGIPEGFVELKVEAKLHTPFQSGKKVILLSHRTKKKLMAVLEEEGNEIDPRLTVSTSKDLAHMIFKASDWQILPEMEHIEFEGNLKGENHEIIY